MSKKAVKKSQPEAVSLSTYVSSLFKPLHDTIERTDFAWLESDFEPEVHRDALCLQVSAIEDGLDKLGKALDAAVEKGVSYDTGDMSFTFMPVVDVSLSANEDHIGAIFGRTMILTAAADLIQGHQDIDQLEWGGISHIFHITATALEQHFLDACEQITGFLGEVTVTPGKGRKKTLSVEFERAEEVLKMVRDEQEARQQDRAVWVQAKEAAEVAPPCTPCPVLDHLFTHHRDAMEGFWVVYEIDTRDAPRWKLYGPRGGIDLKGGCLGNSQKITSQ